MSVIGSDEPQGMGPALADDVPSGRHGPESRKRDMPTLEERVAALEAKVDGHVVSTSDLRGTLAGLQEQMHRRFEQVDYRFTELQEQMHRRFEHVDHRFAELQGQINQRFDAADQKVDRHFTWLVGIQVAALVAVVGALVGSYYR
jgi:chaperonin cofactor prefoldin